VAPPLAELIHHDWSCFWCTNSKFEQMVILLITLLTGGELSDESILSLMAKC